MVKLTHMTLNKSQPVGSLSLLPGKKGQIRMPEPRKRLGCESPQDCYIYLFPLLFSKQIIGFSKNF